MPRRKVISDEAVLDATGRVLLERGPHAFTLAQVSKVAGIAPATLIQRFGTKQGLLQAFGSRAAPRASGRPKVSDEPPLKVLVRLLLERATGLEGPGAMANRIALMLEELKNESLRAQAARQAFATELLIERLLEQAGFDAPERAARVIYAAWTGALLGWALRGEGSLERYLKRVLGETLALLAP
jgi:AcrR family transcriptional regulator